MAIVVARAWRGVCAVTISNAEVPERSVLEVMRLSKLKQRAMQLQQMVTMRFQWNFADEDDEDMPQVVDLPPGVVL